MTAKLTFELDMSDYQALKRGTKAVLAQGTARAVRIGLEKAAEHARTNHVHIRRTGDATSAENLFGEIKQSNDEGTWGYLVNKSKHAWYIEYGTKAHVILPLDYHWGSGRAQRPTSRVTGKRVSVAAGAGRGMALRFTVGGRVVFRRRVNHRGSPALPFMAPASKVAEEVIQRETEQVTFHRLADLWK